MDTGTATQAHSTSSTARENAPLFFTKLKTEKKMTTSLFTLLFSSAKLKPCEFLRKDTSTHHRAAETGTNRPPVTKQPHYYFYRTPTATQFNVKFSVNLSKGWTHSRWRIISIKMQRKLQLVPGGDLCGPALSPRLLHTLNQPTAVVWWRFRQWDGHRQFRVESLFEALPHFLHSEHNRKWLNGSGESYDNLCI